MAQDKPINVSSTELNGVENLDLKPWLAKTLIKTYLQKARTLGELTESIKALNLKLIQENISQKTLFSVDLDRNAVPSIDGEIPCKVVVQFFEQPPKSSLHVGTSVYSQNGTSFKPGMDISWAPMGRLGYGEKLSFNLFINQDKKQEQEISLTVPLIFRQTMDESVRFTIHNDKIVPGTSNYQEKKSGTSFSYKNGKHNFIYEWSLRALRLQENAKSPVLFYEGGISTKSSIKYEYSLDTRDRSTIPTRGHAFKFGHEFAGLFGNVLFLKSEVDYQRNWTFVDRFLQPWTLNLSLSSGILYPFRRRTHISDRFFLGLGPARSFRGFAAKGIGVDSFGGSIGGDAFGLASSYITVPLLAPGFFGHFFCQVGNLLSLSNGDGFRDVFTKFRFTVGTGMVIFFRGFRIELNYSFPLKKEPLDVTDNLQFSFHFDFP